MLYIGIDTGVHTGFAVWDSGNGCYLHIATVKIHAALEMTEKIHREAGDDMCVLFEDARQRKWFGANARQKMQGAGSVKRDAVIWEDFLTDKGIPFRAIPPQKGATKWSAEYFSKVTGWSGRTSEHARDAALLVFNR